MVKVEIVERVSHPQWRQLIPIKNEFATFKQIGLMANKCKFKKDINTERLGS